jgi:hypothetical protein
MSFIIIVSIAAKQRPDEPDFGLFDPRNTPHTMGKNGRRGV